MLGIFFLLSVVLIFQRAYIWSYMLSGLSLYYIICTVLQCDLPPLRPHCG